MPDPSPAPLTPEELRELVELEEKATCAPWIHKRQVIYSDHGLAPFVAQTLPDLTRFPSKSDEEYAERNSALIVSLRNAAPRILSELAALREENERLRRERADGGTKAMPPRSPPPPPPRPVRAVAGTSLVCTACGCRWKKHPPDDVFPNGSLQLYDADQRPCVECCDNTSNPPLRHETPNDAKGDPS